MSQEIKVTGMVLQAGNIGEYDKRIVLLTKERGRISAFARGAKKATSQYAAACQPFTFGEFSLYEGKNSFNLMWAGVENYFDTLKKDLDLIYYASYFCELASYLTRENNDELEILKLLYQTLRALEKKTIDIELVRCIYEIKILALYGIGIEAFKTILQGNSDNIQTPGVLALIAAIISIASKEAMYWYTRYHAKRIDSSALMADAWHHRSDAFSSIGALVGIAGSRLGFPIMDSIASLVIFVFIVKAASDIFKDAIDKMVDHSCDEEMETQLRNCVMRNPNVHKIDVLRTRIFGNKIYVDVEIALDGSITLQDAHDVAEKVHNDIEKTFPKVKHIMVHVNPAKL